MNSRQLCDKLEITRATLRHWLRQGLPRTKVGRTYQFDAAAVRAWLDENGLIESDAPRGVPAALIVESLGDVADFYGVSIDTVKGWSRRGMPGRAGPRGSSRGHWDLVAIVRWREQHIRSVGTTVSERTATAKADIEEYKAERMRLVVRQAASQLIDRREVETFFAELIIRFREQLQQLPNELQRHFPVDQRTTVREASRRFIAAMLDELSSQEIDVAEFIVSDVVDDDDDEAETTVEAEPPDAVGETAEADEAGAVDS